MKFISKFGHSNANLKQIWNYYSLRYSDSYPHFGYWYDKDSFWNSLMVCGTWQRLQWWKHEYNNNLNLKQIYEMYTRLQVHLAWRLLLDEMESVASVQILNKSVCTSLHANILGKGIHHLFSLQLWQNIFIIQDFWSIVFIFIIIFTMFQLICPLTFFRCFLSNSGANTEWIFSHHYELQLLSTIFFTWAHITIVFFFCYQTFLIICSHIVFISIFGLLNICADSFKCLILQRVNSRVDWVF